MRNGVGLVTYNNTGDVDAIDEYSRRLVKALCERGNPALYRPSGLPGAPRLGARPSWVLVQYQPFSYGRWGVAPQLVGKAFAFRRRFAAPFAVMVHESWVATHDWKSALMGGYQRAQLRALSQIATVLMATTQDLARELGPGSVHVPVGSNITPVEATYRSARDSLAIGDELVIALFGRDSPARALDHARGAIDAIAALRDPSDIRVLNLGADAPLLETQHTTRILSPGKMSDERLSLHLSASDLMLLPFTDGLSTRRTTLMAALAHGLPVLGLRSPATDDVLLRHDDVLTLTPVGDPAAYARAATDLVSDRDRLREFGEGSRRIYEEHFDWPHVARRVMSAIDNALPSEPGSRQIGTGPA